MSRKSIKNLINIMIYVAFMSNIPGGVLGERSGVQVTEKP